MQQESRQLILKQLDVAALQTSMGSQLGECSRGTVLFLLDDLGKSLEVRT